MKSMIREALVLTFFLAGTFLNSLVPPVFGQDSPVSSYGILRLLDTHSLPVLDKNLRVCYEGSIDKKGLNADWDWSLYQDKNGEWVIFDVRGAGCIYNIVQHRYLSSREPAFKFYFDGDTIPRFTLRLSEFGEKHPFVEPLASSYIGPYDNGRGPIRVARSFVPMPFKESCKITTDIRLEGFDRQKGEGGWGHVVYHMLAGSTGVSTFDGTEDYRQLENIWKQAGSHPALDASASSRWIDALGIRPGEEKVLLDEGKAGVVEALRFYWDAANGTDYLRDVWIRIHWDGNQKPDVYCPIGALAGNSLGYHNTVYLLCGYLTDGLSYNYFPMPFWKSARIVLENRGNHLANLKWAEVQMANNNYQKEDCGYFRNTPYYARKHTPGADSWIGHVDGTGKMVAAHVTAYAERPHLISCEGDVRVYIDGRRTPSVESDGSESYVCYGWGFPTPSEFHPSGGYDGLYDNPWSMTRLCMGDSYPFYGSLDFYIESGEHNNQYLEHEGTVFYYGREKASLEETDSLLLGDSRSRKKHACRFGKTCVEAELESCFEGNQDSVLVKATVCGGESICSFDAAVNPGNQGVRIRRMSDQAKGRQMANVWIDNVCVGTWYVADSNPYKRWLEDEFEIPSRYTAGKSVLNIRIEPVAVEGKTSWNAVYYKIFSYLK